METDPAPASENPVEEVDEVESFAREVPCDSCLDDAVPAVKTCLACDTSLCESHYRRHLQNPKFGEHELVEAGVDTGHRKCEMHKKRLQFFCTQDESLVCSRCAVVGEHRGHEFSTVEDEFDARKKQVAEERQAVREKSKEAEASVTEMETAYKHAEDSISETKACISGHFTRMRATLDEDEAEALGRVDAKGLELLSLIEENIAHRKREISEMREAAERLSTLEQEEDVLTFIKGHLSEIQRRSLETASDLKQVDIGLIRALEGAVVKVLAFMHGRSPTLDANSAHNNLKISSDLRTVAFTGVSQRRPSHAQRFDVKSQALCRESFSSGQHYWEVRVAGSESYRIGMAYGTMPRKGNKDYCRLGWNDASWSLCKINDGYSARHDANEVQLSLTEPPERVGIYLDWEAGILSFYDAGSMTLLESFQQTFAQAVYPGVTVWDVDGYSLAIMDFSPVTRERGEEHGTHRATVPISI